MEYEGCPFQDKVTDLREAYEVAILGSVTLVMNSYVIDSDINREINVDYDNANGNAAQHSASCHMCFW